MTVSDAETEATVLVTVNGDTKYEPNETLNLDVTSSDGDGSGVGTITNDDSQPTISIANPGTVIEGDSGTKSLNFAVSLSNPSYQPITVAWAAQNGTAPSATSSSDFTGSGTLTFQSGQQSPTIQPSVTIVGDNVFEPTTENFTITLSAPTNATLLDGTANGTITDNDPQPTVSIADASTTEGDSSTTRSSLWSPSLIRAIRR